MPLVDLALPAFIGPGGGTEADQRKGREGHGGKLYRIYGGVLNAGHVGKCHYGLVTILEKSVEERHYMASLEFSMKELQEALKKVKLPCL